MLENPCDRDCPRRKPGCGANCPDWQDYVEERDANYAERKKIRETTSDYVSTRFYYQTEKRKKFLRKIGCNLRNK